MNKWRDGKGTIHSTSRGILNVNDNREACPWPVTEVHHIAPDYVRMRHVRVPAPKRQYWAVKIGIVSAIALVAVIYG